MAEPDEYLRFFPKPSPYRNQREAMDRIHMGLARGQDVLFEGACGTGKTLAALVPALGYAREHDKTVVITTNVHQQMRQFVHEAREITRTEPIRAVVFRGKASMCHIDVGYQECQVLRDNTYEVVDSERDLAELERREAALLDRAREGDDSATEARAAVMEELSAIQEELDDRRASATCDHYYENLTREDDAFYRWLFEDVRTPDDVYEYAHAQGLCGYELLKEGMEGVDLVVCNYHHLLDPGIRQQFFRWLGREPEDVVTVFDEAHNVADAARDHASLTLTENTLESALDELREASDPRADAAVNVLSAFHLALVDTYDEGLGFGDRERIGDGWEDVPVANDDGRDDLTLAFLRAYTGRGIHEDLAVALELGAELDAGYEEAYREGEAATRQECQTLQAATFVEAYLAGGDDPDRYPVVGVRRDESTDEIYGRAELYTCIPREVTSDLFGSVHASVLMSATLRPFDVTADVLGLADRVTLAYGLTFPEERRRTFAVDAPPLFASRRDDPEVLDTVTGVLADAARFTPGNVLAFFPSYAEARRYHDRLQDAGPVDGDLYLDEPGVRAEELRQQFVAGDDGLLLTSLWGTLAEGVSFDADDARTVAVVGVPYPHLDDRTEAVQRAYERAFGNRGSRDAGWEYAVEIPTVRKTRQALGRVVRSPEDFGVRLLVDRRYCAGAAADMGKYSVHGTFPPEERDEMVDVEPSKLKFAMLNFFSDLAAYDGPPPIP